jgi:hypothetical protein
MLICNYTIAPVGMHKVSLEATPAENAGLRWGHSGAGRVCAAICM